MRIFDATSYYQYFLLNSNTSFISKWIQSIYFQQKILKLMLNKTKKFLKQYQVQKILDQRKIGCDIMYLVKWVGYSDEHSTWQPLEHLRNACAKIKEWESTKTFSNASVREIKICDQEYTEQQQFEKIKKSTKKLKNKDIKKTPPVFKKKKTIKNIQVEDKPKRKYTKRQARQEINQMNMRVTRSRRNNIKNQMKQMQQEKIDYLKHKLSYYQEISPHAQAQNIALNDVENEINQQDRLYICEDDFELENSYDLPYEKQKQNNFTNLLPLRIQDRIQQIQPQIIMSLQTDRRDTARIDEIEKQIQKSVIEIKQIIENFTKIQLSPEFLNLQVYQEQKIEKVQNVAICQQIDKIQEFCNQNQQNRFIVAQDVPVEVQIQMQAQANHPQQFSPNLHQKELQPNQINLECQNIIALQKSTENQEVVVPEEAIVPQKVIIFKNWINYDQVTDILKIFKQKETVYCTVKLRNRQNLQILLYQEIQTLRPDLVCQFFNRLYPFA